ncbi:MAG TPA: ferritin-like domain-containing protein [Meiothermus sp.]|jgi:ferritin-like metal-binding protein YciE|nr:ferritin-like domain-containing protein [Meiothermus sp.]
MQSLQELYLDELRDAYDAERQLTQALPKMMEAASSPELRQAFELHLQQTEEQCRRLEQIFERMGESPEGEPCEAMQGLIEEGQQLLEKRDQADPEVLDAALIAAGNKVEHYEIASYGTLCTYAEMLGDDEAKRLLGQTLEEEKMADKKLTALAERKINRRAAEG